MSDVNLSISSEMTKFADGMKQFRMIATKQVVKNSEKISQK